MKFVGLVLLALVLCVCAAHAASDYSLNSSPPKVALDLASVEGATTFNLSTMQLDGGYGLPTRAELQVGEFSINFYNEKITKFTLYFGGFIIFGDLLGNETDISTDYSYPALSCPFPSTPNKYNQTGFNKGLAFAWSDYDWSAMPDSAVTYKVFGAGSCPYPEKAAQSCLVIQGTNFPYTGSSVGFGNVTTFIFSSGDFLVQVNSSADGTWGNNQTPAVGVVFGIQSTVLGKGVTYPGKLFCNATANFGWEGVTNATGLQAGDTFGFYITAPCTGNQVVRSDGLGCSAKSSAAPLTAAWIDAVASLFA